DADAGHATDWSAVLRSPGRQVRTQEAVDCMRSVLLDGDRTERARTDLLDLYGDEAVVRSRDGWLLGHWRFLCDGERASAQARRSLWPDAGRLSLWVSHGGGRN